MVHTRSTDGNLLPDVSTNDVSETHDDILETHESMVNINVNTVDACTFDEIMQTFKEKIGWLEQALETNKSFIDQQIAKHSSEIKNLQTRISYLVNQSIFTDHLIQLHQRKLDDQEQYSRKPNLILDNIEVDENESPDRIMKTLMTKVNGLNLDIKEWEFDRCHRIGSKFTKKDGKTYQKVILRMCSWRCQNEIYKNRKRLPFFITADLTNLRQNAFDNAKDEVQNNPSAQRVVDFIFIDENCKMKIRTKQKKYYGFSTFGEFMSLVNWLDNTIPQTEAEMVGEFQPDL